MKPVKKLRIMYFHVLGRKGVEKQIYSVPKLTVITINPQRILHYVIFPSFHAFNDMKGAKPRRNFFAAFAS
jgi:hypothetical protein